VRTLTVPHLLGVTIENIQSLGCQQSVPHRDLLSQGVGRIDLAARLVPAAIFIDDQLDVMVWVVLAEDIPVRLHDVFHASTLAEPFVPVLHVELQRLALGRVPVVRPSAGQVPGVVVNRPPVNTLRLDAALAAKRSPAKLLRPVEVLAARADGDEFQRLSVPRRPGGEFAELFAVLGGREVAATAPGLIAHAPVFHVVGLAGAVVGTLPAQ
jgi:hypothetical protein